MTTPNNNHIKALEAAVGDPRRGLPEDIFQFVSRVTPLINVDLLIKDERSRTLLTWRNDEFFGPGWHIPGGIIRYQETSAERIRLCAREELGAQVSFDPGPLFVFEDIGGQDTRGHHISLLYSCRLLNPPDEARRAANPPQPGEWRWHAGAPPDLIEEQRPYARFF